jgi:hypothetical protein
MDILKGRDDPEGRVGAWEHRSATRTSQIVEDSPAKIVNVIINKDQQN